ncbi:SRPBCC domain-containing protein [Microlunatus panaciterrae]|uniref:Uncharacterized protein YndB with AHSA1/START domain n=1 Tax=Microlunatus panaciterrae TaxID=400768 RepID=A0ABS2RI98_9ACTN|nr:SRPBCC domain-containing protein [Microlunatus panaciterrae]MBM7798262.1 uncharacterized protein YndB with AHSA1/START domain [Microlunatus panaciterrae]
MENRPGDLRLEMGHVFPAAASEVFEALSEAEWLARWWGPVGFSIPNLTFNARVGARYRIEMQPPSGGPFFLGGELREVLRPLKLSYTFAWEDPDVDDVETLVTLVLRAVVGGGATEVALTQGPFRTEARLALHREGWTDAFEKLERLMTIRA